MYGIEDKEADNIRKEKFKRAIKELEGMYQWEIELFKQAIDSYYNSISRKTKLEDMELMERTINSICS